MPRRLSRFAAMAASYVTGDAAAGSLRPLNHLFLSSRLPSLAPASCSRFRPERRRVSFWEGNASPLASPSSRAYSGSLLQRFFARSPKSYPHLNPENLPPYERLESGLPARVSKHVNDFGVLAGLDTPEWEYLEPLERHLTKLQVDTGIEVVLATFPNHFLEEFPVDGLAPDDLDGYATLLFDEWQVGQSSDRTYWRLKDRSRGGARSARVAQNEKLVREMFRAAGISTESKSAIKKVECWMDLASSCQFIGKRSDERSVDGRSFQYLRVNIRCGSHFIAQRLVSFYDGMRGLDFGPHRCGWKGEMEGLS